MALVVYEWPPVPDMNGDAERARQAMFLFFFLNHIYIIWCLPVPDSTGMCHMRRRIHVSYEEEDTCVI